MFDINFFMKASELEDKLASENLMDIKDFFEELESFRNVDPVVYNIETTNACNMRCKMCPRTTRMARPVETMDRDTFFRIAGQIKPFTENLWSEWERYVAKRYRISRDMMSENHFFLYIIPKVIQLHGYGDPLMDENLSVYVKHLTARGIPTYFSCNPANIDVAKTVQMFENGLDYIKYSIESVEDENHKKIRGSASNFSESYKKILKLLEFKEREGFETTVIITMLDLNRADQIEEFGKLRDAFKGLDVYIYLKSEDQQWYRRDFHGTKSIHWSAFCKHPWMSMTLKSNGEAVMCMEDYNNEIILGNAVRDDLKTIWNSEKYAKFRKDHLNLTAGIKCTEQCDMKLVGGYLADSEHWI